MSINEATKDGVLRPPYTFKNLVRYGMDFFTDNGVSDPATSTRMLVCHALDWNMPQAIRRANEPLESTVLDTVQALFDRRKRGEPLQYIVGRAAFYNRDFACSRAALIPRPETELLVHELFSRTRDVERGRLRIADIGTGSGVIAITLDLEMPNCEVVATDVSKDALALAETNARRLGASVRFLQGGLFDSLQGSFDIIVSNPPYIISDRIKELQPEIQFEPLQALDGGEDGMSVVGPLLDTAPRFLNRNGGIVLIEIDPPISDKAATRAQTAFPGAHIEIQKDFNGLDRLLWIVTQPKL